MNDFHGKKSANLGIPPRWLKCPRKGTLIAEKFLPFKTPLGDNYNDEVPEADRFSPTMLLTSLKSYQLKMGLWIDLTNTTRFYGRKDIESEGVTYIKLQCRGHKECPSVEQTKTFIQVCHRFISQKPLEVIGVHCTHGFNRTGFLIVAYLVENLSWSVEAAVDVFAKSRYPGIYKADYLQELFRRYGDVADTPSPPPLPDWCDESDDTMDDDGNPIINGNSKTTRDTVKGQGRKRKEFFKKNPTFMEGVPGVVSITKQPLLSEIQQKCQEMCGWKGSGFPGSQPVSMDNHNLIFLQQKPYKVSWKADGTRYMMLIDGQNQTFFIDRDNAVFHVSGLTFPRRKEPHKHICKTLLDGEMIIDKVAGENVPRYLVYDIIKFENQDVGGTDFDRRLLCIGKEIIGPRKQAMEEGRIDRNKEPFSVRAKGFWDVTQAQSLLGEKFTQELAHDVDGLIFQPVPDSYVSGSTPHVLKWKPPSLNSVDFKLVITRNNQEGCLPVPIGLLYVGGLEEPFDRIKVTKTLRNLDKKIIECRYESNEWKFLKERTDKSFPNSFTTAMSVCNSIADPVTKEKLLNFIGHHRWRPHAVKRRATLQDIHSPSVDNDLMPPPK